MQAIQLTKYGKPEEGLRLVEIAEPGDPKSGQILIRVEYSPINDSDLLVASGLYAVQPMLPSVVGNEGAGKVLAVGDGVRNVKEGDRVVVPHGVFSWAQEVLAPAEGAIVLPPEIDPQQAAMLSINPPAAALLLDGFISLKPGDWIVQNAANSGVGRAVIVFAKQKGVRTINIVRRPELVHELKKTGADVVLLAGPNTATDANRATGGTVVRLALDGVGGAATGTLLEIVGWDAKIVCYAAPTREPIKVNPLGLVAKHASIHPFFMYYPEYLLRIPEKIRAAAALVASHQLRVPIAAVYPARRFEQALAHALAGGKVLLDFTEGKPEKR
ncbi:MAG TPA: zinc-dependent alcohol dehydrogenase family protein [Planctomycetaceae bacterium]|jgi:NADPH:quinone reductase-like Zn-dependent oxidoreductase|nr:zinc-dependent alcohol dehydrogenase family protein [Planctomycetaceae bacterium]